MVDENILKFSFFTVSKNAYARSYKSRRDPWRFSLRRVQRERNKLK